MPALSERQVALQQFAAAHNAREYLHCRCGFPLESHGDDETVLRTFHRRDRHGLGQQIRFCPRCDAWLLAL